MSSMRTLQVILVLLLVPHFVASADKPLYNQPHWTPLQNQPCTPGNPCFYAGVAFLLTDGTVMVQDADMVTTDNFRNWYRLTPDSSGSYVNGTWSQLASLPSGYAPQWFASAVLANGKVIVDGGEFNYDDPHQKDFTTLGYLYDPLQNIWTYVTPPLGWSETGDAPSSLTG